MNRSDDAVRQVDKAFGNASLVHDCACKDEKRNGKKGKFLYRVSALDTPSTMAMGMPNPIITAMEPNRIAADILISLLC